MMRSSLMRERADQNGVEDRASQQFVERVTHLPMVALTLSRVLEAYQRTKLRNEVLRNALEKGEDTVRSSWNLASLLANKTGLQVPLNMADSSACYLLTKVEEKLPIITYTPGELMYSTMRVYDDNICRPLANMKENTVQKYNDAKEYGTAKLTLGAATVKTVLDAPVNRVNQSVEWSLNTADSLVDKLLPNGDADRDNMNVHDVDVDNFPEYEGNYDHARVISLKLRQRVLTRVADNVHAANLLAQALHAVDSLKQSSAATSVNHVLDNIRRLSSTGRDRSGLRGQNGEVSVDSTEQGALKLVKQLSGHLKDSLEMSSQQLARFLPQPVTERIQHASQVAKDINLQVSQARNVEELPHSLLGQVNSYVTSIQATMNAALDVLTETYLLKWLVPEYKNIGSLDIHIH